ncbi:hypothetical protein STRIP9103_05174 [Streptomyces ipomoeae 91-03]|uniref:Uncharacterized protein n=1 Tax=Streptomyces ipomoeae 91-03 TaxID=698759 RepID=L1L2S4_9ACTN|nr:hypothetical protein STRIP9103_05174 [Streptomyces ipomoeae 91-03]
MERLDEGRDHRRGGFPRSCRLVTRARGAVRDARTAAAGDDSDRIRPWRRR